MLKAEAQAAIENNRVLWDVWTRSRGSAAFDDLAGFRAGESTLSGAELAAIGDVGGRRLLHLQCHFGLDSLTLARIGADVTGVDFSEESIALARELAAENALEARFVHSDVYRLPTVLAERFDLVYTSRGALCWLPDIQGWAHVVAHMLAPGGRLHVFDTHPTAQIFDEERAVDDLRVRYPYFGDPAGSAVPVHEAERDVARIATVESAHQWTHTLGEIVSALAEAGLSVDALYEHEFSYWQAFPNMSRDSDDPGIWRPTSGEGLIPLTFSLDATRS